VDYQDKRDPAQREETHGHEHHHPQRSLKLTNAIHHNNPMKHSRRKRPECAATATLLAAALLVTSNLIQAEENVFEAVPLGGRGSL